MIDFEDWWEHHKDARDSLNFYDAKYVYESQQAKIDELQAKVDSAVKAIMICEEYDHAEKLDEIYNLLKGSKDEN